jgi:hypothetical protein
MPNGREAGQTKKTVGEGGKCMKMITWKSSQFINIVVKDDIAGVGNVRVLKMLKMRLRDLPDLGGAGQCR